jgi:hypothetical protein
MYKEAIEALERIPLRRHLASADVVHLSSKRIYQNLVKMRASQTSGASGSHVLQSAIAQDLITRLAVMQPLSLFPLESLFLQNMLLELGTSLHISHNNQALSVCRVLASRERGKAEAGLSHSIAVAIIKHGFDHNVPKTQILDVMRLAWREEMQESRPASLHAIKTILRTAIFLRDAFASSSPTSQEVAEGGRDDGRGRERHRVKTGQDTN